MIRESSLIYLSMGSNLGDRYRNLQAAIKLVEDQVGRTVSRSRIFESTPRGFRSNHLFYNCCISVFTQLDPLELLERILAIETSMGRKRDGGGYADRQIDLDLLFFGDRILNHPRLTIPHPELEQRRFVLLPLSEIAPDLIHPVTGKSISELLEQCRDNGRVAPVG